MCRVIGASVNKQSPVWPAGKVGQFAHVQRACQEQQQLPCVRAASRCCDQQAPSSGGKSPSGVSGTPAWLQAQGQAQSLKQQNAKLHDQVQQTQQQLEAAQRRMAELESQVWGPVHV